MKEDKSPPTDDLECQTCKGDEKTCAEVPSLRHCEKANRDELEALLEKAQRTNDDEELSIFYSFEAGWHFSYKGVWYGNKDLKEALRAALERAGKHD